MKFPPIRGLPVTLSEAQDERMVRAIAICMAKCAALDAGMSLEEVQSTDWIVTVTPALSPSVSGMAYTGKVVPGGTPDTRELSHLIITKVAVDPQMSNNCYVLRCRATDEQVLIDAADDAETLSKLLGAGGVTKVLTTHSHWDHHRALKAVVDATGAVTVAGEPDADDITEQTEVSIDDRVVHGDTVDFGDIRLQVIHIVGHTPGSVAFLYDDPEGTPHLWTGDSLFPGGVGNTFGDAAAFVSLISDVETKIFGTLPDETWFYPGHGNDSTLGAERPHLPEWRARGW